MGKSISELNSKVGDILICESVGVTPSHLTVGKEYPVIPGPAFRTDVGSVWGIGGLDGGDTGDSDGGKGDAGDGGKGGDGCACDSPEGNGNAFT